MRILLADDSGTMRAIQRRYLNRLGLCDVIEANDGAQALASFDSDTFDVVLTDWNMPIMDGLALLKAIRLRSATVPVIMITTEAEHDRVREAIEAGVSEYLVKPFTPAGLKDALEKWVALPV